MNKTTRKNKNTLVHDIINNLWYSYNDIVWKQLNKNDLINIFGSKKEILSNIDTFINPSIINSFNTNSHIIIFENTAYNLKTSKCQQLSYKDNMTLLINYNLDPLAKQTYTNTIIDFLNYHIKDKHLYILLKYLASSLCYENDYERLLVLVTDDVKVTDNILKLLEVTFGDYFANISDTLLTQNKHKFENIKHKRLINVIPKVKRKYTLEKTVAITDNDSIINKKCRPVNGTYRQSFKCIMVTESMDIFDDDETLLQQKLVIINVKNKLKNNIHDIELWKNEFMLILLNYYDIYKKEGLF